MRARDAGPDVVVAIVAWWPDDASVATEHAIVDTPRIDPHGEVGGGVEGRDRGLDATPDLALEGDDIPAQSAVRIAVGPVRKAPHDTLAQPATIDPTDDDAASGGAEVDGDVNYSGG